MLFLASAKDPDMEEFHTHSNNKKNLWKNSQNHIFLTLSKICNHRALKNNVIQEHTSPTKEKLRHWLTWAEHEKKIKRTREVKLFKTNF